MGRKNIAQYKSAELSNMTMKTMADVRFLNNRRGEGYEEEKA
jgi:hypothetical protein